MPSHGSLREREPLLGRDYSPFKFKPEELCKLVDPKNPELLMEYGGTKKILEGLGVNPTTGLSSDEGLDTANPKSKPFQKRQEVFGKNVIPDDTQISLLTSIWELCHDQTLVTLSIAALMSLVVDVDVDFGWVEGTATIIAVTVVVLIHAINDYQKEKLFRNLNKRQEGKSIIFRSGKKQQINVREINVGDILFLEPGDIVPVDCLLLNGHNLVCDESTVTGESEPIRKDLLEDPFILSDTKVLDGTGSCVVIAVGIHSFSGKTTMAICDLDSNLDSISLSAMLLNILNINKEILLEALCKIITRLYGALAWLCKLIMTIVNVASLPEMLIEALNEKITQLDDATSALAFAYASAQMLKDNFLVRVLSACKTMGDITTICSDKTGTLTQSKMFVIEGNIGQKKFENKSQINDWKREVATSTYDILIQGITINSSAFENKDENGNVSFVGNKTECALLEFITSFGVDYRETRASFKPDKVYPFISERKTMTTVIKLATTDYRVHVKGDSEMILEACTHYVDAEGKVQILDDNVKRSIIWNIINTADRALRTICFAYRDLTTSEFERLSYEHPLSNLVYLGLVGIQELLRPGVKESIETLRKAGVMVKMITGDKQTTANAIARDIGIFTSGLSMRGPDFRKKSDEELDYIMPRLQVLARSSPADKDRVVKWLKRNGEIVAVTGDGTNDGLALKSADIGFSMGMTGTEIAKKASSIVLMNDDFNSIVKALKWGRAIKTNVRKFIQFRLTIDITVIILSFITTIINKSFLTAVQLICIKLIMGSLSALALSTESPTDELLDRNPISKKGKLINYRMWKMIFGQTICQIAIILSLLKMGPTIFNLSNSKEDIDVLNTLVFNTFAFLQIFNIINCRSTDDHLNVFKNIINNHTFIIIQIVLIIGQFFIVEYGNRVFGTVNLKWYQWLITILIGFLSLPVGFIIRLIPNICVPRSILNEDHKHIMSHSKMQLSATFENVRTQTVILSALRGKKSGKKDSKRKRLIEKLRRIHK